MKKFKGFGARRRSFEIEKGSTIAPTSTSSVKSAASSKISSPAQDCLRGLYVVAASGSDQPASIRRRRSVDNSQLRAESEDLQAVRREIWEASDHSLRLAGSQIRGVSLSSSDSFSSAASDVAYSSSRLSNASGDVASSMFSGPGRHVVRAAGDDQGGVVRRTTVVIGFDANSRDQASVSAAVLWAFRNAPPRKGDVLVLVGVMGYIRGPLGYKVQVNDQTWLGANANAVRDETRLRNATWAGIPGLKNLCNDAGVALIVDVKAAASAETAIVKEAVALDAAHVVLDKSLRNRRRRYYLDHLSCDVTRMRRSGGIDCIRSESLVTGTTRSEKLDHRTSPTSVLSTHRILPLQPPRSVNSSSRPHIASSLYSSDQNVDDVVVAASPTLTPVSDDTESDLFSIDMALRINMLLTPQPDHHRRSDLKIHRGDDDDDEGYESDDLFSLAGDGLSRRPSIAFSIARSIPGDLNCT